MRKLNGFMVIVWMLTGILVAVALIGGIAYDWNWMRLSRNSPSPVTVTPITPATSVNSNAGKIPDGMNLYKQETFALKDVDQIFAKLGLEDVVIRFSGSDSIVVSQYGEEGLPEKRIAEIQLSGSSLEINSPSGRMNNISKWNKESHLEILLPAEFSGHAEFSVSMGELTLEDSWNFERLYLHAAMGDLHCESPLSGKNIEIQASMGEIRVDELSCERFTVQAAMGDVEIGTLIGGGKVESSAGAIKVRRAVIVGALEMDASMGDIQLALEKGQSFRFEGKANMGEISTYFPASASGDMNRKSSAVVGDNPTVTLNATANMGSIHITEAH